MEPSAQAAGAMLRCLRVKLTLRATAKLLRATVPQVCRWQSRGIKERLARRAVWLTLWHLEHSDPIALATWGRLTSADLPTVPKRRK